MPEQQRPNPQKLLQRIQKDEQQQRRGKLKIYLGAAPGVGKTYTMLQDAIAAHKKGLDIVVGVVESHGRQEIETLLQGLEILPKQNVEYRGKHLQEFSLENALKRHPGLILMDEMAHTNAPGLFHSKRWQDIKELLDRGIDVCTTLNVQHIETLSDDAAQIIHAPIKEIVPDSMVEMAETIELVDLAPEDLLKRLQEGKVYIPKQAELAVERFFRKGNLIALRELALRTTAERVGAQVLLYRQDQGIKHIWPTKEKILVCVGSRPESAKLIRAARRMATSLQAEWIAVYVDTPKLQSNEDERNHAIQNLRLAEQLGGETRMIAGFDIVKEIMTFAREQNVTQIMVFKHIRTRWRDLFFRNLTDEIVRSSGEIDVYIMTGERASHSVKKSFIKAPTAWRTYGIAFIIMTISTILNFLLFQVFPSDILIIIYLLGVIAVSFFGQTGPAIFASVLSVLAYDFFFVPPFFSFLVQDIQHVFTLAAMFLITQVISHLTILTRRQAQAARLVENQTSALYNLSRQLAGTRGIDKLLEIGVKYIGNVFDSDVIALFPKKGLLAIRARFRTERGLDTKEQGVAQWVYDLGQMAGLGTETLPFSDAIYIPLLASQGTIGVLRIHPSHPKHLFTPEQMRLLEACANQIALALEVDRLQEQSKKSELRIETDRIRSELLQSVSHDLRTPLVAVMGAASTLMEMGQGLSAKNIKKLGKDIYVELEQLSRLINNLLQIAYLETENIKLEKQPHSLRDTIADVINASRKKLGTRQLNINLPENIPLIPYDNTLIQDVFINLLDNTIKFTPPDTSIDIEVTVENNKVIVSVEDQGPGIVPDEVNKLFEKFYRGRMLTAERGMGLGLAICKLIIKAHGGDMWAENRKTGGAAFRFTLLLG